MAVDSSGNVTVVSGPGFYTALVVTSYTSTGVLRWQRTVTPLSGTMAANWVVAAPNDDVVVLGSTFNTHATYAITMARFTSDGTLRWRIDPPFAIYRSSVGRLVVDSAGSTYVTFNNVVAKYNSSGTLLWNQTIPAGFTTSLALGPDDSDVVVTGNFWGSVNSVVASFDAATGASRWVTAAAEGSKDVVVDSGKVYVTGQSYTGAGTPALAYFLTVVAYDRATGARLWRTDSSPGSLTTANGQRIALAPDGSLVAVGYASGTGYLDWWIVAMEANGTVRWQARRDRATYPDEMPAVVFVLADGTTVVSGLGGPLVGPDPGGSSYPQGVTAGYSPNGTVLWEDFSKLPTVWAAALPSGDVCATGGYDALITCFGVAVPASPPAAPSGLTARLTTGSIVLTWQDNAIDETTFSVERSENHGAGWSDFVELATLPANATSYADTSYTPGSYHYRVRASNTAGYSAYSNTFEIIIIGVPTVPTAIMSATPSSGTAPLTVTFDGSGSTDLEGFLTSWAWAFGDGTFGTGVTTTHVYSTSGTYTATLTVTDNGNVSDTATASIIVNAPALPSAPSNLTATALTRSSIRLNWTNGAINQTEVRIERCRGSGCTNFRQIASVAGTATTYTNPGLSSDTTYRYRVRTYNSAGNSQYSNIAAAKTLRR
jgi:PKD repeat protein